ncbi:cdc42 effector protein 3 [Protopterus annectens]|uniref:cdc42 effector protein 3 n=1 Tax=Protopterus annectens TaxID=7888 RepID=UPI001CFAB28F|nr:cdc42 effector protein 3 [Protopterus annectens]
MTICYPSAKDVTVSTFKNLLKQKVGFHRSSIVACLYILFTLVPKMPAKTPIYLKTGNSKKGKKFKLRDILSPDMISPPLGDFRHTIHIGQEGQHDVFGDMSFLQGKYELLPGNQERSKPGQSLGHNEFLRANSTCDSTFSETPSPVLKNAISLPTIGGSQALTLPLLAPITFNLKQATVGSPETPPFHPSPSTEKVMPQKSTQLKNGDVDVNRFHPEPVVEEPVPEKTKSHENGDVSGNSWKPALLTSSCYMNGKAGGSPRHSEQHTDWQLNLFEDDATCDFQSGLVDTKSSSEDSIADMTGSLLSLQLDLGPSLLDEVLCVMDKNKV